MYHLYLKCTSDFTLNNQEKPQGSNHQRFLLRALPSWRGRRISNKSGSFFPSWRSWCCCKKEHVGSHALNEHFHDPLWSNVFRRTQDISGNFLLQVWHAWEIQWIFFFRKRTELFTKLFVTSCWPWQSRPNFIPRGYIYTSQYLYIIYASWMYMVGLKTHQL